MANYWETFRPGDQVDSTAKNDILRDTSNRSFKWGELGYTDWGGGSDALVRGFINTYGRLPTQQEFAKYAPTFNQDAGLGNQQLQQDFTTYQNSPEQLGKQAPHYFNNVNSTFKSVLGRDATDQEKQHFGTLLAGEQIDPYTLQTFLQQLPEYTNAQDKSFREGIRGDLQTSNSKYFNEKILPGIEQTYASRGRSVDSSAYANSLALAAKDQNQQLEQYLAQLSASQYGGNKASARSDYEGYINQMYGNQNYNRDLNTANNNYYRGRANELQDFNIQKQAYDDYLKNYGKRHSWVDDLGTGLQMANSASSTYRNIKGY